MIPEKIKMWKIIPRSQSTGKCSKSWWNAEPRLGTSGNVFGSHRAVIDQSSSPHQGVLHSWNLVRESAGKPVARGEERNRETIPTPRFVRKPSTNSFFPAEGIYPQNYMAEINQDCRSRSSNLTNSPLLQRKISMLIIKS